MFDLSSYIFENKIIEFDEIKCIENNIVLSNYLITDYLHQHG